jgi:hypothetical protein
MRRLRENRWFDMVVEAGDGMVRSGVTEPAVRREYAQALLDQGRVEAARVMLKQLLGQTGDDAAENAQVRGLLARAHKQMFIDAGAPDVERNRNELRTAAGLYFDVYAIDPVSNHWQGINTVALVALAERHGISLSGLPEAEVLASEILAGIERAEADGEAGKWEYGTAVEACVALDEPEAAIQWLGRYVSEADAFAFFSTRRQLKEVWGLTAQGKFGALLAVLDARILEGQKGLGAEVSSQDRADFHSVVTGFDDATLERVLGPTGVVSLRWYRLGLSSSEAVALISSETRGVGSGFLVTGSDLADSLPPDEVFVLTNAHVVAADPALPETLLPEEARVSFQGLGLTDHHEVTQVWSSPLRELDATLLRLTPPAPDGASPLRLARRLPTLDQRVYIIGHPLGGELSFSLQDNQLIDIHEPKLHYRTPTEPGSSGSGVFNADWKIVALHHAGSLEMPRLNQEEGQSATYAANEGISILAIKQALGTADLSSA